MSANELLLDAFRLSLGDARVLEVDPDAVADALDAAAIRGELLQETLYRRGGRDTALELPGSASAPPG